MKIIYEKAKNNKTISITFMSSLHTDKWLWQLFNTSARCTGNKSSEQSWRTYLTVTQHTIDFTQTYRLKMSSMVLNKKLMAHISQYLFVVNVFLNINQCILWWFTTAEQTCYSISMCQWTNNIPAFSTFQWSNKYSRLSVTRMIKFKIWAHNQIWPNLFP